MITADKIRIGNLTYECPVPRSEQGQIRVTFSNGKNRVQLQGNKLPTIQDYFSLFALHAERPDEDIARLVNDIQEQPLEWANNALLREGRELYDLENPRVREGDNIIAPTLLYHAARFTLPADKPVFTIAELGDALVRHWFNRSLRDIPASLRETVVTIPRSGTIGLVRIGKMGKGYCITSTLSGVQGVARGASYDSGR